MRELNVNEMEQVNGGVLWGLVWVGVGFAFMATDASLNVKKGLEKGYESKKKELKAQNGWD